MFGALVAALFSGVAPVVRGPRIKLIGSCAPT